MINIAKTSMVGMRELRQQKDESDRAGSKLRDTMRTTIGTSMGAFLVPMIEPEQKSDILPANLERNTSITMNPSFTTPMSPGLSPNVSS